MTQYDSEFRAEENDAGALQGMRQRIPVLWTFGGILLAVVLLIFCFHGIDFAKLSQDLLHVQPAWLLLALLFVMAVIPITAFQWRLYLPDLRELKFSLLLQCYAAMTMIQNTVHHFAGQGFLIYRLGQQKHVGKTKVVSLLAQDQIAEGLARVIMLAILIQIIPLPAILSATLSSIVLFVFGFYLFALVCAIRHRNFEAIEPTGPIWSLAVLRYHFACWAHHLAAIRNLKVMAFAVFLSLCKKFSRAAAVWCVQMSLGMDLPAGLSIWIPLVVVTVIDIVTMVSVSPGHIGVFEGAVLLSYHTLFFQGKEISLSAGLLYHLVFLCGSILPGLAVLLSWSWYRKSQESTTSDSVEYSSDVDREIA